MFIFLFAIILVIFLNIRTIDFGVLGMVRIIKFDFMEEPYVIESETYLLLSVLLVFFGILALIQVIKYVKN